MSEADTRAEAVVDALYRLYEDGLDPDAFTLFDAEYAGAADGDRQAAYGGQDAFACLVRTVLSQNTSDELSKPAFEDLLARYDGDEDLAATLAAAPRDELAETIASAGLYNQKAAVIGGVAERVVSEYGGTAGFDAFVKRGDPEAVRETLLEMTGVGPKTADCVLLFAGGRPGVFPVDTHVHRIYRRLGIAPPDADHEAVRAVLETAVPPEKCGFGHVATIQFGREYCTARKPACLDGPEACPLYDLCDRVGVDPATGEVVDPAETVGE